MSSNPLTPAVERTLHLVEMLLAKPEGLSPQELLVKLDISRSSLFLMLRTLKSLGYVKQAEKRGRYSLGPRLEAWRASPSLASQELLSAFYQETGQRSWMETIVLVVPSSEGPIVLAQAEGTQQVRCMYTPGQHYPMVKAAVHALRPHPPGKVSQLGYALSENDEQIDLALPVCRDGRHPEAALLISAPVYRFSAASLLDTFLPDLRAMAARLSYQLGAPLYAPYEDKKDTWSLPSQPMSAEDIAQFLKGPWSARLACIRPDGLPHVIPVWHEWDGESFYLVAWKGSFWAEYVLQNPNISLTVDEPWPPLRRIVARGHANPLGEMERDGMVRGLIQRLTQRYLGNAANLGDTAGQVFRVAPNYLRGWQGTPWQDGV